MDWTSVSTQFPLDTNTEPLLVCFSHLRWDFVFQRPQQLMTRAAGRYCVVFFEEPVFCQSGDPQLKLRRAHRNLVVATPHIPESLGGPDLETVLRSMLKGIVSHWEPANRTFWYYTPMALGFSAGLPASVCVYDCMDELSAFKNAPAELPSLEKSLFSYADLVFTGGASLHERKQFQHGSTYCFPSSIDVAHFGRARCKIDDPVDQASIPFPRLGFFGVIDERMDLDLVARALEDLPNWQFVMLGPIAKIEQQTLPLVANIHWLGQKTYDELPAYLSNWDAGWMPFALNASTRFISPTKTPEFLAAGLPLVSTAIADVVRDYGAKGLVSIADAADIAAKIRSAPATRNPFWLRRVDAVLDRSSWDSTWEEMAAHMERVRYLREHVAPEERSVTCSIG